MMQKSNEEIYKALSEAERNLAEKMLGGWIKLPNEKKTMRLLEKPAVRLSFMMGNMSPPLRDFSFLFSRMESRSQPTIGKLKMELRVFGFCAARKTINLGKSSSVLLSEEMYQLSLVMPRILNRRLTMSF